MCGGGGKAPAAPDPMAEARAQQWLLQEQRRMADEALAREKARHDAIYNPNAQRFNAGWNDLGQNARKLFDDRINPYKDSLDNAMLTRMNQDFASKLANARDQFTISGTEANQNFNFDRVNTSNIVDEVFDNARGSWRQSQGRDLAKLFNNNFENTLFGDTSDDPYIYSILNDQYLDAETRLKAARDRGQLNSSGYDFALRNLGTQRTGAEAKLQQLGGDVLSGYRSSLTQLRDKAFGERDSLDFGQSLADYSSLLNNMVNDYRGRKQGDIRNAVGGEQLFNVGDLINRAGGYQGATNINPNYLKKIPGFDSYSPNSSDDDDDNKTNMIGSSNTSTF